jgi:hypothetical protein
MPPMGFVICWAILSTAFTCAGALWAGSPRLFVKVCRRIAIGDYYIKSSEWEKTALGLGGRLAGCFVLCFGLAGLCLLLRMIHVI